MSSAHVASSLVSADPRAGRGHRIGAIAREAAGGLGRIRIPDFVLFFALAVSGGFSGLSFQPPSIVLAVLFLLGAWRRPKYGFGKLSYWVPLTWVAFAYIGTVSSLFPESPGAASWQGRMLRLAVTFLALFFLASGRLDLRSAIMGYATAAVINIPLFYAGLVSNTYGGYLTGWFGDKNVSGMVYCFFGLMVMWLRHTRGERLLIFILFALPLWLTGSRTSIAGYVGAAIWIVAAPRLSVVARWVLGALIYFGVTLMATGFSQIGVFASRAGSDALRGRIDTASLDKVHHTGIFGSGLGEAFVDLRTEGLWFFHNSYWTALVEGGWPWLVFMVAMTVIVMIQPFVPRVGRDQAIAQGLGIAALVCASQLGEVFGTIPWAIAIAFGLHINVNTPVVYPRDAKRVTRSSADAVLLSKGDG